MAARGWTPVHRMPGAVLLARVQHADGATAVGVGVTGVAAGGAVGAAGMAVGISGAAAHDQTLRLQAWTDDTGRIFTKGA